MGLKFSFQGFFGGRKIWRVYFWAALFKYMFFLKGVREGIQNNMKIRVSARVSRPRSSAQKSTSKLVKARKFDIGFFGG